MGNSFPRRDWQRGPVQKGKFQWPRPSEPTDTVLIVDDEEIGCGRNLPRLAGPRPTSTSASWSPPTPRGALLQANEQPIDLAVPRLGRWGAGEDGLETAQGPARVSAGPSWPIHDYRLRPTRRPSLDAMRMGRPRLPPRQETRTLSEKNLPGCGCVNSSDQIRPAKREAAGLNLSLRAFREAVEKNPAAGGSPRRALNDPVPLPEAVRGLFRFLLESDPTPATAFLLARYLRSEKSTETSALRAYDAKGQVLDRAAGPVRGGRWRPRLISMQEPCAMENLEQAAAAGSVQLQAVRAQTAVRLLGGHR